MPVLVAICSKIDDIPKPSCKKMGDKFLRHILACLYYYGSTSSCEQKIIQATYY